MRARKGTAYQGRPRHRTAKERRTAGSPPSISYKPRKAALWACILLLCILLIPSPIGHLPPPEIGEWRRVPRIHHSLLLVGDSLSIALGEHLERHFSRYSNCVTFQRQGKVSSGLARPEFFDWNQNLAELVERFRPDIVIVMIGTNDNKPLRKGNSSLAFGTMAWSREYTARLQRLYDICRKENSESRVFWIGAPIMGDPALSRDVKNINRVIESWCRDEPGCEYVSTWSTLADTDGQYTQSLRDRETGELVAARSKDGVHLAPYGAFLLARIVIESISKYYVFD